MAILYDRCPHCGKGKMKVIESTMITDCDSCRRLRKADPEFVENIRRRYAELPDRYDSKVLKAFQEDDHDGLVRLESSMAEDVAYTWRSSLVFSLHHMIRLEPVGVDRHTDFVIEWFNDHGCDDPELFQDIVMHYMSVTDGNGGKLRFTSPMFTFLYECQSAQPEFRLIQSVYEELCGMVLEEEDPRRRKKLLDKTIDFGLCSIYVGSDLGMKADVLAMCRKIVSEGHPVDNASDERMVEGLTMIIDTFLRTVTNLLDDMDGDERETFRMNAEAIGILELMSIVNGCLEDLGDYADDRMCKEEFESALDEHGDEYDDRMFEMVEHTLFDGKEPVNVDMYDPEELESEIRKFLCDGDYDNACDSGTTLRDIDPLNWIAQIGMGMLDISEGETIGCKMLLNAVDMVEDGEVDDLITLMAGCLTDPSIITLDDKNFILMALLAPFRELEGLFEGKGTEFLSRVIGSLGETPGDEDGYGLFNRGNLVANCITMKCRMVGSLESHARILDEGLSTMQNLVTLMGMSEEECSQYVTLLEDCIQLTTLLSNTIRKAIHDNDPERLKRLSDAWRDSPFAYDKVSEKVKIDPDGNVRTVMKRRRGYEDFVKSYLKGPPGFKKRN